MKELTLKHTIAALSCTAALVASLTACGSGDDKPTLPLATGGSSPSATATSRPTTAPPAATATGPVALAAQSTYDYNGLKFVVNLPPDISAASRPRMRLFSEFLQGVGRTTAANKLDPSLAGLTTADVLKERRSMTGGDSVQGIGVVTLTLSRVDTVPHGGPTQIYGCLDQSKLLQVRKDGTQFDEDGDNNSMLKMSATIERTATGSKVSKFDFTDGPC
jgi:hypothetical protein